MDTELELTEVEVEAEERIREKLRQVLTAAGWEEGQIGEFPVWKTPDGELCEICVEVW
jgi:hypothetical protein